MPTPAPLCLSNSLAGQFWKKKKLQFFLKDAKLKFSNPKYWLSSHNSRVNDGQLKIHVDHQVICCYGVKRLHFLYILES